MRVRAVSIHAERLSRWLAVALGFSIPVSTALDGVLTVLLALCWAAGGRYREKLSAILDNPVALLACALFAAHALGALYSVGSAREILHALDKATVFLVIPILISLFIDERRRDLAMHAFMTAIVVTLALSYLVWLGVMPETRWIKGDVLNPVVFRLHITHSLLVAFSTFLFAVRARYAAGTTRLLWSVLAGLAAFNVLYMVQGRTGQLVLFALLFYYLFWLLGWRGLAAAALGGALVVGTAYLIPSSTLHQRTALMLQEMRDWQPGHGAATSVGYRLDFYRTSLAIMRENPVLGVGTGGFPAAYARQVAGTPLAPTLNPHNEYLMIAVQLGAVGLALLLWLFAAQWKTAGQLGADRDRAMARALVLTIATASMVSSTLIDHTEGLFYAWASGILFAGLARRGP
jgi:O-antigen ligase